MPVVRPYWKFLLADLEGAAISDLSKITSDRVCDVVLNAPLRLSGRVPTDNPQVWIPYDGDGYGDPYLNEGTRLLWGFQRESLTPPYYSTRAATIVKLVGDTAQQDDARTAFVGNDPWDYLFSRPVTTIDGDLPGPKGISYSATDPTTIILQLLDNTIANHGHVFIDAGLAYGGTIYYSGTLESLPPIDINFAQGTSVGQAWRQICNMGVCDIYLNPIYDPFNRPNYLVELNIFSQLGDVNDAAIFAWNMPGRSLVGLDRQDDGAGRANDIIFHAGQGGVDGSSEQLNSPSINKFGVYVAQQFFPAVRDPSDVDYLAQQQLALRATGRHTVTFKPAPERSPRPWIDYGLGDRVPVWASPEKFRKLLGSN